MGRFNVAVVIPALNEFKTIELIINDVKKVGTPIVIDDGSLDGTGEIAVASGAIVVRHKKNLGYDEALKTGFKKASELGFDVIITIDADGQHDSNLLGSFVREIDLGFDLVVGSRNKKQRFAEVLFGIYTKWKYGIEDPLCGMKAYSISIYNSLGYFDSYNSIGTELMLHGAKKGYSINQIDIVVKRRLGKSRFGTCISGNCRILRALYLGVIRNH